MSSVQPINQPTDQAAAPAPAATVKRGRPKKYKSDEEAREHRTEYMRVYYQKHKESMNEAQKRYRERTRAAAVTV